MRLLVRACSACKRTATHRVRAEVTLESQASGIVPKHEDDGEPLESEAATYVKVL
jgi:hypothetical protein